ncbi:MAG TPA: ABC transporter permease, partial [Rhodanobacteraceae bacterium]
MNTTASKIWLAEIWRAWRASLRRPGFLLLAAGVLTLGIGASVAVFTLIDQVLLQPLPIPEPSRVVVMGPVESGQVSSGSMSPMRYQHLQRLPGVKSIGIAFSGPPANIAGGNGTPVVVSATYIDQGVLPTLGLRPILGRNFNGTETVPQGPHVALLSHELWERRFGGNPDALGQTLQVDGHTTRIIGVLPAAFGALSDFGASIVLPFHLLANSTNDASNQTAIARLAPGASAQTVSVEVNARLHAMYASMGNTRAARYWSRTRFGVQTLAESQNASAHGTLVLFMACALFVLLAALVNLANLMLLRSLSHAHDSAVRGALGAPPLRLALPSLAEG